MIKLVFIVLYNSDLNRPLSTSDEIFYNVFVDSII